MSTAVAIAAAIANAIKASGVLVRLEPGEFLKILGRATDPLVVISKGGFLSANYKYLFAHKGLAFYTKSGEPLPLPGGVETVAAGSIWMPS